MEANGRKNSNSIAALNTDQGELILPHRISDYLLRHFKNLLGSGRNQPRPFDLSGLVGTLLQEELRLLDDEITEEEVLRAIKDMPTGEASGPDGLPQEFYKAFWQIIKGDVMDFIRAFLNRANSIKSINKAAITLIPKKPNPDRVSDYRPISVINTSAKLITKIMAKRLQGHLHQLIAPNQTAFVKGRSLMESFLAAREYIIFAKTIKLPSILYKVDFEKAFDTVDWCFLVNVLILRDFLPKWTAVVLNLLQSSSSTIKVNGENTEFFTHRRGLRQGDPLSPMLFILVADSLTSFLQNAQQEMSQHVYRTPKSVQFANDTLIITEAHPKTLLIINQVIRTFFELSGLKLNRT